MTNRKIIIIHNPKAGGGRSNQVLQGLQSYLEEKGFSQFYVYSTTRNKDYAGIQQALKVPHDLIVIIGGDGTLNDCINAIQDAENERIVMIPSGSGNDFARCLYRSDERAEQYFALCESNTFEPIDIGVCNGRKFINGLGVGFDSKVARWSEWAMFKYLGGSLRYHLPVYTGIFFYQSQRVRLLIDEEEMIQYSNFMLTVGNGEYLGSGYRLAPGAEMNDQLLDLICISKINVPRRIMHLPKAKKGTHTNLSFVKSHKFKNLKIEFDLAMTVHIDGELIEGTSFDIHLHDKPLHFACLPEI